MYLDDGISRNSAPEKHFLFDIDNIESFAVGSYSQTDPNNDDDEENQLWDAEAKSKFCLVRIEQVSQLHTALSKFPKPNRAWINSSDARQL
jgi:hypothetical protein